MKKSNNTVLYVGLGILGLAGIMSLKSKPKTENTIPENEPYSGPRPQAPAPVKIANKNLVLKKGSKGIEVVALQKLLGISADGIFGNDTQKALLGRKGVIQISLNGFESAPDINKNPYKIGDKVMSNATNGAEIYKAISKANNVYYTNFEKDSTIPYGQKIGTIRSMDATKTVYSVYVDAWIGQKVAFVKAKDVKKY